MLPENSLCNSRIAFAFFITPFLFIVNINCIGQQPGGVSGTKAWYITDPTKISRLVDASGNNFPAFVAKVLGKPNRNINFHPAAHFQGCDGNCPLVNITLKNFNANQGTVIGCFFPFNNNNSPNYKGKGSLYIGIDNNYSIYYNRIDSVNKTKLPYGELKNRSNFEIDRTNTTNANAMKSGVFYFTPSSNKESVWGETKDITTTSNFFGYIPELIIYKRGLSNKEIRQVQSYLSVKYGTTLDTSYFNSKGETIWDINNSIIKTFHHRVFAIGRDTISGLWQPKSNTTYEDNGYLSYENDANDSSTNSNTVFIPKTDIPSLYRSLTMELVEKTQESFPNNNYLFWGDNDGKIALKMASDPTLHLNSTRYPNLHIISNRSWLLYNQNMLPNLIKLTVAGNKFGDDGKSLFNTLYKAYDYQLYRYVLIQLDADTIKSLQINSYFGREQFVDKDFNTRTLVWDSLTWINNNSAYQYFTFGRVPILSFLEIGKTSSGTLAPLNYYPYFEKLPISNTIAFDTLESAFVFKPTDNREITFTISPGMGALKIKFYKVENGRLNEISDAVTTPNGQNISSTNEDNIAESTSPTDTSNETVSAEIPKGGRINRHIKIANLKSPRIKFIIKANKITPGEIYLIRVEDPLGQVTTLPFKTKKAV